MILKLEDARAIYDGAMIAEGVVIYKDAEIYKGVVIYNGAMIGKDAVIGKEAVIYKGAEIREGAEVRKGALIGQGAVIREGMEMIVKVKPTLSIELNVDCPECNHCFDMVAETNLNEEGWLLNQVIPDKGRWVDAHETFMAVVICPECSVEFQVEGVEW